MEIRKSLNLFSVILILIQVVSCGKGKDIPDVSNVSVAVHINRFEQDLFSLDTTKMVSELAELGEKDPEFLDIYLTHVLGIKNPEIDSVQLAEYIKGFIYAPAVRELYDTCQLVFPQKDKLQKDFEQAFKFFKYYFPEQPLSGKVVTYLSEYSLGGFLYGENSIGIGLDFYLGQDYPYQQLNAANPNFSAYLTRSFNKEHIVLKAMMMLVQDINGNPSGNRLLDFMIQKGKELYILGKLLPYEQDSILFEYSHKQVEWVNENEANIWAYLISENLLYSTDWNKFRKLVEYSPNSPGMPDEAPGRTANWLGLQIVKAYMKRNPNLSLDELIAQKESQIILDGSKYKPPR